MEYPTIVDYVVQVPSQLSDHLRALRKAKGLSQKQLGELVGVNQARIAKIENNATSISVDQLLKILATLGVRMVLSPPAKDQGPDDDGW